MRHLRWALVAFLVLAPTLGFSTASLIAFAAITQKHGLLAGGLVALALSFVCLALISWTVEFAVKLERKS